MINPTDLSWTGSSEREDNTPYLPSERRGYNVYIEPTGNGPTSPMFTATAEAYTFSMPISDLGAPLAEGIYDMYITDVDTEGRESAYSLPITFEIVVAVPKPPTGLAAL